MHNSLLQYFGQFFNASVGLKLCNLLYQKNLDFSTIKLGRNPLEYPGACVRDCCIFLVLENFK